MPAAQVKPQEVLDDAINRQLEAQFGTDLLAELGGVQDAQVAQGSLYDPAFKKALDAERKVPVFIPTPEGHRDERGYAEWVQINGVSFIIRADTVVMVPESVKAILDNKALQNRIVQREQERWRKKMSYTHINQVDEFIP